MRRPMLTGLCALLLAITVGARPAPRRQAAPPGQPSPAQPVYLMLSTTIDDPWHVETGEERLQHVLDLVKRTRTTAPNVSCLCQFSGTFAEALVQRNGATHLLDALRHAASQGLIEFGYDGSEEPTFVARPRPNFRFARTPEDRWLARTEAARWFLDEFKDPLTGEPDPSRSGGLRRVLEVFGDVRSVHGASLELGGDPEVVNLLRRRAFEGVMPGLPESTTYPARLLHGYRGGSAMHGRLVAPDAECAPELFWQDNVLRISDSSGEPVKVLHAVDGPEAARKVLSALDRTRTHVIRVRLGVPTIYMKPGFANGRYASPLQYVYDNPKGARLPEEGWQPRDQVTGALAREDALVSWLATDFVRENPGSRFVSVEDLTRWTSSGVGAEMSRATLAAATKDLLDQWALIGNNPPSFARSGRQDLSLADMYQLLSSALEARRRTGSLPQSVALRHLYGPLEMPEEEGPRAGRVRATTVTDAAARLHEAMTPGQWQPLPVNAIPAWVEVAGIRVNAAQFLRLMAETYLAPEGGAVLEVKPSYMFSAVAEGFPRTRPRAEAGAAWTLKPARLLPRD